MEKIELLLNFIYQMATSKGGFILLLLWILIIIVIYILFIMLCKIIAIIEGINKNRVNMKEMQIKNGIYHRFAEISREALKDKEYGVMRATAVMESCYKTIFGKGDGMYESADLSEQPDTDSESIPEQSGQSTSGVSNGTEESSAQVAD